MREKKKSRKIKVILFASIVLIGIVSFLVISNNNKKSILSSNTDKVDKNITRLVEDNTDINNEIIVEDKGEESATEEIKTEVSNTPKIEEKKKEVNNQNKSNTSSKTNKQENIISQEQPIQQPTTTPKQEEVVNDNSSSSNNSPIAESA